MPAPSPSPSRFERSVTVQGGGGRYVAEIDPAWNGPVAPNGGVLAATMLRALQAELGPQAPAPRSLSAHFLDAPSAGAVELEVEVLRPGRRVVFGAARMRQGDRLVATATIVLSAERPATLPLDPAPIGLPPRGTPLDPTELRTFPPVFSALEVVQTEGPAIFSGGREARTGGWIGLRDDPAPLDPARVVALCDLWWPAVFAVTDGPAAVPTLALTVDLRHTGAPPTGPAFARFASHSIAEGHLDEVGSLYAADGTLLAESRQLAPARSARRGVASRRPPARGVTMELCLMIEGQEGVSWPEWLMLAQTCEESGIASLYRSDHYLNLDGEHPERGSLDAWGTICALAARTERLRLGTMVSPASFRHPSVLAKLVTTADHVSDGRVELGLGAGWHEREHAAYGFPFHPVRERMDVLEEQIQIVLGTWADSPFSFGGAHYALEDLRAEPRPVQHPHPPLILGGTAGPRSARLAARYADEYNTVFPTVEDVRRRRAVVEEACAEAGRSPLRFSIMTAVIVGVDDAEVRDRVGARAARMNVDAGALLADPPPGWIVGTVEAAAAQLRALAEAGVERVMCQHFDHADLDMVRVLGERLAPLVG